MKKKLLGNVTLKELRKMCGEQQSANSYICTDCPAYDVCPYWDTPAEWRESDLRKEVIF